MTEPVSHRKDFEQPLVLALGEVRSDANLGFDADGRTGNTHLGAPDHPERTEQYGGTRQRRARKAA
ncbi:hypothetical protein [Streptomyces cyaneofuscatus]|uniref:hypothetical protein n=1 Tax=Streptomyces cyaneofuscatus TaxID=66883 RepID=UPI000BEF42C8